ncbi:glycoside hydrolase family 99-like domain-containing protein [Pinibacter soli]|uniref:Glycoside hydrolase family 99-like domain-containing protein n=1 Tax=Pinibacter soli TaxID=3044211 RepID=A0ABT6RF65_9BACT|nr:glycoside hydrolase family 99-like domain-containing protein [Pinibacter soli]MDI3321217.1 glycoside hydrolase family 99-like domain-containing protein [Pinibacter soli]
MQTKYFRLSIIAIALLAFIGCVKKSDAPTAADNFLNYQINEIPVTNDYTVGAMYYYFGAFNVNVPDTPTLGRYSMPSGVVPPDVMSGHIDQANSAGIDYFLFSIRSFSRDYNNFKIDSNVVRSFLKANTANKMKLALAYNWQSGTYGLSTTTPLENDKVKLEQFFQDILKLVPYMQDANYMKVNGKTLLYIYNAQVLYSNDNATIYTTLRQRLNDVGVQLYIVGQQDRWTPPARYPFRFQKCVDAMVHQSFSTNISDWDRFYLLPQMMNENWKYSVQYWQDNNWGVSYVPCVSPGWNQKITQPTTLQPLYGRSDTCRLYKQLCNVAKMNADQSTRLILLDSWNDWASASQLESAKSYGDLYLTTTRKEFKK